MAFGFLGASERGLGVADHHVRVSEIAIELERALQFGNPQFVTRGQRVDGA